MKSIAAILATGIVALLCLSCVQSQTGVTASSRPAHPTPPPAHPTPPPPVKPTPPPAPAEPPLGSKLFDIGQLRLVARRPEETVLLHADGRLEVGGKVIGRLRSDGTILDAHNGIMVSPEPGDTLGINHRDRLLPVGIRHDRVEMVNGDSLRLAADGTVVTYGADGRPLAKDPSRQCLRVEGLKPALRGLALYLMALLETQGIPPE